MNNKTVNTTPVAADISLVAQPIGRPDTSQGWKNALKPKGKPGPKLTLASGGATDYTIVRPAQPAQDAWAAEELAQCFQKMTGAKFVVKNEVDYKPTGKEISVGRTQMLQNAHLAESTLDLGDEGYAIAVKDKTLFLFGGRKRGAIYAVYALLEEDLGCRWYDNSEPLIPDIRELTFSPVSRHWVPALESRNLYYLGAFDKDWALANRINGWRTGIPDDRGGCMLYANVYQMGSVHTFQFFVPKKDYFDAHPEYFSEIGGVRKPSQLCLTNPDVLNIVTTKVKEILRREPRAPLISVSPNDGLGYCECKACKAIDDPEGSKMGTLLQFVNQVACSIQDEFPNVRISTLAYLDTLMPPKTIAPRKNVVIELCTDSHAWWWPFCSVRETQEFQTAMKAWKATGATIFVWDYTVNFSHYPVPMPNMQVVADNLHFYLENGATGVMFQGEAGPIGDTNKEPAAENATMRCWVWAKQLWNPSLDTQSLMRDFIYGYYGEAAEPMWKYNRLLRTTWEYWHKKPHTLQTIECENPLLVVSDRYPPTSALFCKQYLDQATALFEEAERLAKDSKILDRVKLAKFSLLYVKLCQGIGYFASPPDGLFHRSPGPKPPTPERVAEYVDKYSKLLKEFAAIAENAGIRRIDDQNGTQGLCKNINQWCQTLAQTLQPFAGLAQLSPTVADISELWTSLQQNPKLCPK